MYKPLIEPKNLGKNDISKPSLTLPRTKGNDKFPFEGQQFVHSNSRNHANGQLYNLQGAKQISERQTNVVSEFVPSASMNQYKS